MTNYLELDEVSKLSGRLNRLMIIGCSGSGKSTLAQHISTSMDLRYISMDRDVRWLPGWKVRDASARKSIVEKMILGERWIMDGTSPSSFDIRLPRTDLVLWIRVPRYIALFNIYCRVYKHFGTTRPDMAQGCVEQLPDGEFLSYIWNFNKITAPIIIRQLELHGPDVPVIVLKNRKEMRLLVSQLTNPSPNANR